MKYRDLERARRKLARLEKRQRELSEELLSLRAMLYSDEPGRKALALRLTLQDLAVPARFRNALIRRGIKSVVELIQLDPTDVFNIPQMGKHGTFAIQQALGRHGLALAKIKDPGELRFVPKQARLHLGLE